MLSYALFQEEAQFLLATDWVASGTILALLHLPTPSSLPRFIAFVSLFLSLSLLLLIFVASFTPLIS